MPEPEENEAFESAVARLPYPVFVVDSEGRFRPLNREARQLWDDERMHERQLERFPSHPLSRAVARLRAGSEGDEATILQLEGGTRYEVIHSLRSPKGSARWLMLMLRPFPMVLPVDPAALRKRWPLTTREAEVAAACIAGRSSAEICEQLGISRETLKTHMSRVLLKSDSESRTALIAKFVLPV